MIDVSNNDFTAIRIAKSRFDPVKGFEWQLNFKAWGSYKSISCRVAERSGVRYASHRKGYRASDRAMAKFLLAYDGLDENAKMSA